MADKTWTPLMLLAQIGRLCRHVGQCPTVEELARHVNLPADQVEELLKWLLDKRYIVVDCGRVYPWEAGPSPVVTYKLSPEEVRARYGPPANDRAKAIRETIGYWSEQRNHLMEEAAEMPKGVDINWPSDKELVAQANEIQARGGNVVDELAECIGCSPLTIKKRLRLAKLALLRDAVGTSQTDDKPGAEPASSSGAATDTEPNSTHEPDNASEPHPGELMQMAEQEATRLVEASRSPQEPDSEKGDTSAYPKTQTGLSEAQGAKNARTLVLLSYCSPESPPPVIVEQDTMDRAPERPGDEWAELVRVNGRRTYRLWRCVAVLPDGAAILLPIDAAIVQTASAAVPRTA